MNLDHCWTDKLDRQTGQTMDGQVMDGQVMDGGAN